MARLWNPNRTKKAQPVEQTEAVVPTQPVEAKPTQKTSPDLSAVIDRLNKLEEENKTLKASLVNPSIKAKEINNDPKMFKVKLRGGVPVVKYISKKKDPTKDFVYKNQFNVYVEDNHLAELHLANGETLDVAMNEFGLHHTKSDYMVAKDQNGAFIYNETLGMVKTLTFEMDGYEPFTCLIEHVN